MSEKKHEGTLDSEEAVCRSLGDAPLDGASEAANVNCGVRSSDGLHETDGVFVRDNARTTANEGASPQPLEDNCNQNSNTGVNNVAVENCFAGEQPSASGATVPEASAAAAAACSGIPGEISAVDLDAMIARQRQLVSRVKAEREEFIRRMELAETEIQHAAERMYGAVDNRVNELIASASEIRSERVAALEQAQSQVQSRLASMNYHHLFAEELLKHGTPAEVTHYAPLLHAEAERIRSEPMPEMPRMTPEAGEKLAALQAFAGLDIEEMRQQVGGNLVGHITRTETVDTSPAEGESAYLAQPRLISATAVENGVVGVAFLDVDLFVIRERSSVVEVYSTSEGLALLRQISVEQMTCPTSIAACASANCLFISDAQVMNSRRFFR